VARGYTDGDIARHLALSEKGVKSQLVNVFRTLNVSNRLELVIYVLGNGLLQHHGESGESSAPALPNV
jgi:DNA-binding NarL/FixJ family response regulator